MSLSVNAREVTAKSVLTRSRIPGVDYCVNPYVGCTHACRYCYASFMMRFTGHQEPWGTFVDAKVNAPEVLERELVRAKRGTVMVSSVTDAYQSIEERYQLTRRCLEVLLRQRFPVDILTKSPLVLRDLDLLSAAENTNVGLSVTTDDERMRSIFEPAAPPLVARLEALRRLQTAGISTYVFVGPLLPMNPERLAEHLSSLTRTVYIDRMNYTGKTKWLYRRMGLDAWLDAEFVKQVEERLIRSLPSGVATRV